MDYFSDDPQQDDPYTPPWLMPSPQLGAPAAVPPVNTPGASSGFNEQSPIDVGGAPWLETNAPGYGDTMNPGGGAGSAAPPIPSNVSTSTGAPPAPGSPAGSPTDMGSSSPWSAPGGTEQSTTPGAQLPPGWSGRVDAGGEPDPNGRNQLTIAANGNRSYTGPDFEGTNSLNFSSSTGAPASDAAAAKPYQPLIDAINTANGPDARATAMDALAQKVQADLEADGHKVSWDKNGYLIVDGRSYELGGAHQTGPDSTLANEISTLRGLPKASGVDPGTGSTGGGTATGGGSTGPYSLADVPIPDWLSGVPDYTPTPLSTDLSEIPDFESIYSRALAPNETDAKLEGLVKDLLDHPESLSEEDIARLKAKSAEDAAVASQANDEDLLHFGASGNLMDSPWLAGQRASNAQSRRNTTIQANQSIDIAAADRRQADRLAVAGVGQAYGSYKSNRNQAALNLALDSTFKKYGEQRNRVALNASMEEFAAQHGLSKAQLIANYVTSRTGQQIDVDKLNEMSAQFQQDLAFKISQLSQQSDQFDAQMQLELQKFQHAKDNDAWTQAMATYGK